jgi:hypothetical protein
MKGFLLGVVVAGLGFGAYMYWKERLVPASVDPAQTDAGAPAKETREKKKRRRRGAMRVARNEGSGAGAGEGRPAAPPMDPEPEPVKLSAGDLKLVSQGDDLSRPDVLHLDMSDTVEHELGQDEIDSHFRAREDAILSCIARARPDEETYVPGRVTVKFRIQRSGNVRGVRVEAPAILQRGGIYACVKGVVMGIHFPASSGSQIVSYPFSLT